MTETVRIAIVGAGAVSDYHHVPGIRLDRRARLVAVCDRRYRRFRREVDEHAKPPADDPMTIGGAAQGARG